MNNQENKFLILGLGSWGTALGQVLSDAGWDVVIWGRDQKKVANFNNSSGSFVEGQEKNQIQADSDLEKLLTLHTHILCALPTQAIRRTLLPFKKLLRKKILVNASKGIEIGTQMTVSEIFRSIENDLIYLNISGPSFSEEVKARLPTAVLVTSGSQPHRDWFRKKATTNYFKIYTSYDVLGSELGGALKNVVAIASGITSGMKLGFNAQAAIINRGLIEMARLGKKIGANPLTFLGLSGVGDLVLTSTSALSRNRKLGVFLGEGNSLDSQEKFFGGITEGYYTAKSSYELCTIHSLENPIFIETYNILYEKKHCKEAMESLMSREFKEEWNF